MVSKSITAITLDFIASRLSVVSRLALPGGCLLVYPATDLRDRIWEHYKLQLHELITEEVYQPSRADDPDAPLEDRLF